MKEEIKNAIEEYQCPGCACGGDVSCFENNINGGVGCAKHVAGTFVTKIGAIFLGMPRGFNRLGVQVQLIPLIFETFESSEWKYDKWNIPTWKYLSKEGHTFVRGISPRKNEPFLHVFLENCIDKIDCLEITQEDVDFMD
jgi:hypothetical protein